jgi:hypothetical protein
MDNRNIQIIQPLRFVKLTMFFILFAIAPSISQVVIGGRVRSNAAMLEIKGTNDGGLTYKGLLPPRIPTVALRDAMIVPDSAKGMLIFVTEIKCLQIFNGVSWESINCLTSTPFAPFSESFETDGNGTRYALSAPEGADAASDDYFIRTDGTEISYGGDDMVTFLGAPDGSYFFAAQDIDGVTGISTGALQTMNFTGIDITTGVNLQLDILIAEDDSTGGSPEHWDEVNDSFNIQYQIDGGGFQNLFAIESQAVAGGFNDVPRIDTDFDGIGDGTIITNAWTNYTSSIIGSGVILDLRIQFYLNSDGEDIAIDHIRISSN